MTPAREPGTDPIELMPMVSADLGYALDLTATAGWNQRAQDWQLYLDMNPGGAFVARHRKRVVGTVTTTRYEDKVGWIGMVLVDPAYRGQGIATRLLKTAMDALADMDTLQLDATPAGRQVYLRLGFADTLGLTRMTATRIESGTPEDGRGGNLRPMRAADLDRVTLWDARIPGARRRPLLEGLLAMAPEYAWVLERGSRLAGFVMGRRGTQFEHVGPLLAVDLDAAKTLVNAFFPAAGSDRG